MFSTSSLPTGVGSSVGVDSSGTVAKSCSRRHASYAMSQRKRKLIEEPFGWGKTVGPLRKTMLRGIDRVRTQFTLTMAAYNLAKLPRLVAA